MNDTLKTFSIRISEELHAQLEEVAAAQYMPISQLVRQAFRDIVAKHIKQQKADSEQES